MTRSYDDGCAAAHGLSLVGDRWALLVVRELLLGPKRFTDLRAGLPHISPNVLTQRLEELERFAIVRRRKLAPPAAAWVYELTEWGAQLEPVVIALGRWAARSPFLPQGHLNVDSLILSFRTMFNAHAAGDFSGVIALKIDGEEFHATIRHRRMELIRGSAKHADATIESDSDTLAEVVYAGRKFADLKVSGKRAFAKRFVSLFPLPERAPAALSRSRA